MNKLERIKLMAELAKQSAELYYDFDNEIKFISTNCMELCVPAVSVCGIHNLAKLLGVKPVIEHAYMDSNAYRLVIMHEGVKFYEFFDDGEELPDDV